MNERIIQLRRVAKVVLFILLLSIAGLTKAQTENITFANAIVKAYCVANWDTDGDGELNQAEAAAVTSLDGVFMFDDGITSFDELQFFTGLTSFGDDEFNSCTNLASITIPNAVTSIGNSAFSDCSSLTSMTSYACTPPALGNDVFYNVPSILVLNVPCHTSAMYQEADGWSDFSNYEEFEYGLCPIPFADATVKAICVAHWDTNEDGELSYAEAAAVTDLGTYFKSTAITSFDELEYFTSLTSIPNTAFYGCINLVSITLPSSVSALGNGSFYNCTNLATMTVYAETPPTVGTNAFKNVSTNMVVHVPCETYNAFHNANDWNVFSLYDPCLIVFADANVKNLCVANWDTNGDGELSHAEAATVTSLGTIFKNNTNITSFDELQYFTGLSSIGYQAFYYCSSLTSITIPNSVTSIGYGAFYYCTSLISITVFAEIPPSLNSNVFFNVDKSIPVYVPCNSITVYQFALSWNEFTNYMPATECDSGEITVTINSSEGGTVTGTGYYEGGATCTLTATASFGYIFMYWMEDGQLISRNTTYTFYVSGDRSLVAVFEPYFVINTIVDPDNAGTIYYDKTFDFEEGFDGWTTIDADHDGRSWRMGSSLFGNGNVNGHNGSYDFVLSESYSNTGLVLYPDNFLVSPQITLGGCITFYASAQDVSYASEHFGVAVSTTNNNNASAFTTIQEWTMTAKGVGTPTAVTRSGNREQGNWYQYTVDLSAYDGQIGYVAIRHFNSFDWFCLNVDDITISKFSTDERIYFQDQTCFLTAVPNDGFVFINWKENGEEVSTDPSYSFTVSSDRSLVANFVMDDNIVFADANVKALCVANWDTDGDGELSYIEAAAVTDLGEVFKNKNNITSFDELQYFIRLSSIGYQAFYQCGNLTSIEIPNSVTSIGKQAFFNCNRLTAITIPNSVISIGFETFSYCIRLTSIELPNSVISIDQYAFYGCTNLTSIEIPNSVTSIGNSAFSNCSGLMQITVDSMNTVYDSRDNCNAVIKTSTNELVLGCKNTVIPDSVISIGSYAFSGCTGLTSIEIPNSLTSIGNSAFSGCTGLTSIEIPNSVTSIGSYAFSGCTGLTSIEIPNSVTSIGSCAFGSCNGLEQIVVDSENIVYDSRNGCNGIINSSTNELVIGCKNTVIPNSVTSIGSYAFKMCRLNSIVIPNSITYIGYEAFYYCNGLTSITVLSDNPPTLGSGVFYNVNKGIPVYVPCESVEAYTAANWGDFNNFIGLCAGEITATANPVEGGMVSGIGSYEGGATCTLVAIANEGYSFINWTKDGLMVSNSDTCSFIVAGDAYYVANFAQGVVIAFADANVKALCVTNWDTDDDGELSYSEAAAVTDIGTVFRYKGNITSFDELQYFTGLTFIGEYAFNNSYNLTSIEIPNSVTSIGHDAFSSCNSLSSIEIPNSVTSIGYNAFNHCSGLVQITVDSMNTVYDSRDNCNVIIKTSTNELVLGCKNTVIPNSVTSIGSYAFSGCTGLTSIEIPNSLTSIGNSAFSGCTGLTSIEIPNSVTSIGSSAFYGCTGLTSIEIPNSVTSIGSCAFGSCNGLEQIVVDSENTVYDSRNGCNGIINSSTNELVIGCKNTVIPNSVTSIGSDAFHYCSGLTSIEIPNSVTSVGNDAFRGCNGLSSIIVLANNPPTLSSNVFSSVNKSIPIYVPCESEETYTSASWGGFSNFVGLCAGEITVTANPVEGGTVSGGGYYESGATCTLTATANTGYAFVNWTKDGEEVSNSEIYNFYVAGDASFVANFVAIPPVPVIAEYFPEPNEPNSPYVKVNWAASSFETQIGEGTSTFGYFPFYTLYNYSIAENLFLASELMEAGVTSSPMTSLSWYATNAPGYEQQGISIWMANVSDTGLTTTSHTVNDMTLVYTGTVTPKIGWNEFVFNEGNFAWDGVSNVLIYCQRNNGVWNSTVWWQSDDVGFTASSYRYQDSGPYNVNVANTMTTSTKRPNIIMKGEGGNSYNLYRANCDGTDAQLIAENLSDTQYIDETWWRLENDSYKYGVSIADSTNTDIFWSNCIEKQGNMAAQTVTLSQGTNWFSTYLEITKEDLQNALLAALSNPTGAIIKSQDGNSTYRGGRWRDQNFVWDVAKMYMIVAPEDCEITLTGMPINPAEHPITIVPNAPTWIGFPFAESKTPAQVIPAGFAVNGDIIKGMGGNIRYNNGSWRAQGMNILEPGKGYIYNSKSAVSRTLVFPTSVK